MEFNRSVYNAWRDIGATREKADEMATTNGFGWAHAVDADAVDEDFFTAGLRAILEEASHPIADADGGNVASSSLNLTSGDVTPTLQDLGVENKSAEETETPREGAGTASTPNTNDGTDVECPEDCNRRTEGKRTEVTTPSRTKVRKTADAPSVEKEKARCTRRKRQRATEEIHENAASVAQDPVHDNCVFSTKGMRAQLKRPRGAATHPSANTDIGCGSVTVIEAIEGKPPRKDETMAEENEVERAEGNNAYEKVEEQAEYMKDVNSKKATAIAARITAAKRMQNATADMDEATSTTLNASGTETTAGADKMRFPIEPDPSQNEIPSNATTADMDEATSTAVDAQREEDAADVGSDSLRCPVEAGPDPDILSKAAASKCRKELENGYYMLWTGPGRGSVRKPLTPEQITERKAKLAKYEAYKQSNKEDRWKDKMVKMTAASIGADAAGTRMRHSLESVNKLIMSTMRSLQKIHGAVEAASASGDTVLARFHETRETLYEAVQHLREEDDIADPASEGRATDDAGHGQPVEVHTDQGREEIPRCQSILKSGKRTGHCCGRPLPCKFHA